MAAFEWVGTSPHPGIRMHISQQGMVNLCRLSMVQSVEEDAAPAPPEP